MPQPLPVPLRAPISEDRLRAYLQTEDRAALRSIFNASPTDSWHAELHGRQIKSDIGRRPCRAAD